jgi:hypothetical protein
VPALSSAGGAVHTPALTLAGPVPAPATAPDPAPAPALAPAPAPDPVLHSAAGHLLSHTRPSVWPAAMLPPTGSCNSSRDSGTCVAVSSVCRSSAAVCVCMRACVCACVYGCVLCVQIFCGVCVSVWACVFQYRERVHVHIFCCGVCECVYVCAAVSSVCISSAAVCVSVCVWLCPLCADHLLRFVRVCECICVCFSMGREFIVLYVCATLCLHPSSMLINA